MRSKARRSSSSTATTSTSRSEEHTSELQSHSDLHSFPTRRSSDLVTDSEATEAMNDLNSLPDAEQGQAIKQLDGDDFHKLLNEVPEDRREEFKSLVDNTHDPERKLQLWGEYHKSHVENDAKKDAKATEDTGWWPFESKEQDINRHKNKIRNQAVSATKDEVSDEIKFLEEKQKAGTLTETDVVD